jgi:hypothetical protein
MKLTRYILHIGLTSTLIFKALNTSCSPPSQSIFNKSISLILSSINALNSIITWLMEHYLFGT